MNTLLAVEGLVIEDSNGKLLVNNLSFSIPPSGVVSIVGESGSGKSLTALSIMGMLPVGIKQTKGRFTYAKENGTLIQWGAGMAIPTVMRGKEVGFVFQESMSSLNPLLTCGEQLTETLKCHFKLSRNEAQEQAINWLERVRLRDVLKIFRSYPHQISGGQKQRVCIAIALCGRPKLLLADEPTTALDVQVQHSIIELFTQLQEELGLSLLFISHDLKLVQKLGGHIVVLRNGVLQEFRESSALFAKPMAPYTQALLSCRPTLYPRLERLPTVTDFENSSPKSLKQRTQQEEEANVAYLDKQPVLTCLDKVEVRFNKTKSILNRCAHDFTAVYPTSLTLRKGEALGIVGESGSGKTTLIRTWLGLQGCFAGEGYWEGKPLGLKKNNSFTPIIRKKIQLVYQDPASALNPRQSVFQTLAEPLIQHKLTRAGNECSQKVKQLLNDVGMSDIVESKKTTELSGGQKQRLCIARALCLGSEVLVLDEAVSALDVSVQAQILNLLNDLKWEKSLSYIFVSHDLAVVGQLCDTLAVLQNGKLVEIGPTHKLINHPSHPYTKQLIALSRI